MADPNVIHVAPSTDYEEGNPYQALVFNDGDDWEHGRIRIEPPFYAAQDYLDDKAGDVDVELGGLLMGQAATGILFAINDSDEQYMANNLFGRTRHERVVHTTQAILDNLGALENPALFTIK